MKTEEGECGVFFLNKNKPKGLLGIVVPPASLASLAPEEYGCLKRLDHTSRDAPRPAFPPSPPLPHAELGKEEELAVVRGRDWAESREVRELAEGLRHSGRRCWEGEVAELPEPLLTPTTQLRLTPSALLAAGRVKVGIEN